MIEEFIEGREASCLAGQNINEPEGVKVYNPISISFPKDVEFKFFDMKWVD